METIKLDLIPGKKMPSLHASQYDDGRDYHIDLTENRVPYVLDGTETISLTVRKCDNTLVTMDIANTFADKSYIEFRTTEQMNACAGFNYGEITLEKNGTQISSLNFYLQVEGAPDEGGITSQSEINNLKRQVHDAVVEELEDHGAEETGYDNTESGLEATNVQDAIDEVNTKIENIPSVDAYTKEETDNKFATKTALQTVANAVSSKADATTTSEALGQLTEAVNGKADKSDTYTKTQIDEMVNPTSVASGAVAKLFTSITNPLISIEADITGTDTGTGSQTPDNPHVITKFSELILKHYADNVADADTVTIALGDSYYRGKVVITDKGNGYASVRLTATHRAKVLDSSCISNVSWYGTWYQLALNDVLSDKPARLVSGLLTWTSDKLKPIHNYNRADEAGNYITLINNGLSVAVSIPNCTTQAQAKDFISNNTIVFCYELATPIEIDLPDISSIVAFSGENNLLANSGDIKVEYKNSITDVSYEMEERIDSFEAETEQYVDEKTKHSLEIKTFKFASSNSPNATNKNLCFVCGKWINKEGEIPDYVGYLFVDEDTQKYYYTSDLSQEPQFLFDWDSTLVGGDVCKLYQPTITADGDVIFLKDHVRHNPVVYPAGDYSHPYVVDFGANKKPYAWLVSSSVVQFEDGSFVFGDYAYHSLEDEQNDDRRIIWRVTKPYSNPANWVQAHSFKHVYYSSLQSDEPDNEIGHIHAIMYDFYADDLYCTTGDIDRHCRMWISTDKGITWSAVPNAVGTTENTTRSAEGQKWRMTNGVFTKDAIWWGTDAEKPYHKLWKCTRALSGHIDFDTLTEVADLEIPALPNNYSQRTYITALMRDPDGLLLIDRGEPRPDKLDLRFYDFASGKVEIVRTFERASTDVSDLEPNTRIGLCQQATTVYQPQTLYGVITGGGKVVRPNVTSEFNNSKANYVGALIMRLK